VTGALTGPFLAAAGLLCVSGVAKLRAPGTAAQAVRTLGLPAGAAVIRLAAAGELALGALALIAAGRLTAAVVGAVYAGFAALTVVLARRRAACGCFGSDEAPAGRTQMLLSIALALLCAAAAVWPPAGIGWVLSQLPALLIGVGGCVYALALAYTELPAAWAAWSGR
jgi:uncharacterized membrane protein YphA (DoxX/SURF4 family)